MLVPPTTSATPTPQRQEDQRPISSRLGAIGGAVMEPDGTPIPHVIATVDSPRFGEFLNKVPSRVYSRFAATF